MSISGDVEIISPSYWRWHDRVGLSDKWQPVSGPLNLTLAFVDESFYKEDYYYVRMKNTKSWEFRCQTARNSGFEKQFPEFPYSINEFERSPRILMKVLELETKISDIQSNIEHMANQMNTLVSNIEFLLNIRKEQTEDTKIHYPEDWVYQFRGDYGWMGGMDNRSLFPDRLEQIIKCSYRKGHYYITTNSEILSDIRCDAKRNIAFESQFPYFPYDVADNVK